MRFEPYDAQTACSMDRIAWALCQIIDDDAPMRWTRYRFAAECIAINPQLMEDLAALKMEFERAKAKRLAAAVEKKAAP